MAQHYCEYCDKHLNNSECSTCTIHVYENVCTCHLLDLYDDSVNEINNEFFNMEDEVYDIIEKDCTRFLETEQRTLNRVIDFIDRNWGEIISIYEEGPYGHPRSTIRNLGRNSCRSIKDGKTFDVARGHYNDDVVTEREYATLVFQKCFRGKGGRRIATELKYRPGNSGYLQAKREFESLCS